MPSDDSSHTRRSLLKSGGIGVGAFGLAASSALLGDHAHTRHGETGSNSMTATSAVTPDEFESFVDETADAYGEYGPFGTSQAPDASVAAAWTNTVERSLSDEAFDGRVRSDAAVVSYRTGEDRYTHLTWACARSRGARYYPGPFGVIDSPMRLTSVGVGVDLDRGAVESPTVAKASPTLTEESPTIAAYDGDALALPVGDTAVTYPVPDEGFEDEAGGSSLETELPLSADATTEAGSRGAAYVGWSGYGPERLAVAGTFETAAPLARLADRWSWGYGLGTEGPV